MSEETSNKQSEQQQSPSKIIIEAEHIELKISSINAQGVPKPKPPKMQTPTPPEAKKEAKKTDKQDN